MTSAPAARVLVVDDDPQIRHMLATALGDEGHEVREAGHGADGLALVRSWRPDIIILDLMMPTMNGWQFAEAYGSQVGPHVPVIVITAAGPGAIQSAEHLGTISSVLAKPLNIAELNEIISLHLNRSH